MGLFDRKQRYLGLPDYMTPGGGIGGGLPGMGGIDPSMMQIGPDPYADTRPAASGLVDALPRGYGVPPTGGDGAEVQAAVRPGFIGRAGAAGATAGQMPSIRPAVLADQPMALKPIDTSQLVQSLPRVKGPGFFDKDGAWRDVAGTLLDGVSMAFGGPGAYWAAKQKLQDQAREDARWQKRYDVQRQADIEDRDYKARQPDYFSGGTDRLRYDPATGKAEVIYDAPSPAEAYARGLGYEPGTSEYRAAMRDHTLRGWGETALENKRALEDVRQRNRINLKGTPSYSNLNPRPAAAAGGATTPGKVFGPIYAKMARGEALTPGEQAALDRYKSMSFDQMLVGSMGGPAPAVLP
ncbi:hypothetical protein, partial [Rhizorhabdus sp.]|uniref:hypothetical protein n=1 Tax=Rhizorhabdus sp. TaxID=1968843 RepID=UPI0019A66686